MKLIWFGSMTDCEFDMTAAIARHPDIDLTLYALIDEFDVHNDYHRNCLTKAPNIKINEINGEQVGAIFRHIASLTVDLIVIRHPVWIPGEDRAKELAELLSTSPYVVWTWEWVPNYAMAQMPPLSGWKRIAVTNYQDYKRAKLSYPEKQILYLPFGVVNRTDEELKAKDEYKSDIICDAQPHYECKEYNSIKRHSVDTMIKPFIKDKCKHNLALWGSRYGEITLCDWPSTPEFKKFHRGHFFTTDYPSVYSSSKIYLGVSWNYNTGGFSIRLARALSCGVMTIWHETEGRKEDIPVPVLEWSTDYSETEKLVNYYLEEENQGRRETLAKAGKDWALTNLEWGYQLKGISKVIQ